MNKLNNISNYDTEHNRQIYFNYLTSYINSGSIEPIMSFEEFLFGVYKQELDEYYDWLYTTYVVNKEAYYEQQTIKNY